MKALSPSRSQFQFFLLALLTPSTLSLPTGVSRLTNECAQSGSCRPNFRYIISQWESRHGHGPSQSKPQEPHFPPHQLQQFHENDSKDSGSGIAVQPRIKTTIIHHSRDPLHSADLAAILEAAKGHLVQAAANKKPDDPPTSVTKPEDESAVFTSGATTAAVAATPTSWLARLRWEDAKRYGHSADTKGTANRVAGAMPGGRWCGGKHRHERMELVPAEGCNGGGNEKAAYTDKPSFVKQSYTDILVVGIVILFFVTVILVEVLGKVVRTSRILLGLDRHGAIRLEDDVYEYRHGHSHCGYNNNVLPRNTPRGDRSFYTTAEPAPEEKIWGGR